MPEYTLTKWVIRGWQKWAVEAKNKTEAEELLFDLSEKEFPDTENLVYGDEQIKRERGD